MSTTPIGTNLTPTQNQIIALLASGISVTAVAAQLNLHRTNIHHWKHTNQDFAIALQDAKEDAADHHRAHCHQHADTALDSLVHLLDDPKTPASVRLKAALYILNGATGQPQQPRSLPKSLIGTVDAPIGQNSSVSSPATPGNSSPFIESDLTVNKPYVRPTPKIGRNEKCPCGSNKKYKACCLLQTTSNSQHAMAAA